MSVKKIKSSNGETRWQIRVYENGRGSRYLSKTFERKVDADVWLMDFEKAKAEKKRNPFSQGSFEGRFFSEESEYWLMNGKMNFSISHYNRAKVVITEFINTFGNLAVEKISPEFLVRYQQQEIKKGLSSTTVNRKTEILKAILNHSVNHRRIPFDPSKGFKKFSPRQIDMAFWTLDEVKSFLEYASLEYPHGSRKRWIYIVYLLAVNTGLRAGEIWGLQPFDVNQNQMTISIKRQFNRVTNDFSMPKSKKSRVVPCNRVLLEEINQWIEMNKIGQQQTIFQTETGRPICHDNFADRVFRKDLEKWGGRKIRFHDLRHTSTTLMISSGVDLKTVKEICGHAGITTTMNYTHLVNGSIENVARNWGVSPEKSEVETSEK